jgi:hypothetical protein
MVVAVVQLHAFSVQIVDAEGRSWKVYGQGARRDDERWIGWFEFASDGGRTVRVTDRETTQPSLDALVYWVAGIEPIYLEGAFARSFPSAAPGLPLSGERLVA